MSKQCWNQVRCQGDAGHKGLHTYAAGEPIPEGETDGYWKAEAERLDTALEEQAKELNAAWAVIGQPHVCQLTEEQERVLREHIEWVKKWAGKPSGKRLEAAFFQSPENTEPNKAWTVLDVEDARQAGIREVIEWMQKAFEWALPATIAATAHFFPPKPQTREERMEALLQKMGAVHTGWQKQIREVLGGGE